MESIVPVFKSIQDIPYRIPLSPQEEDNCCSWKMIRFKKALESRGYESRYRVCSFRWSDMGLPRHVMDVPHEDDSTHVYLEVFVDGKWINVDPTWDPQLRDILPIAEWDWASPTWLAVKPIRLFGDEESRKIMEEPDMEATAKDLEANGRFYGTFNQYLEIVRSGMLMESEKDLISSGVAFRKIVLTEIPKTAVDVERIFGCALEQVLKTLVLVGSNGPVIAVLAWNRRTDMEKLRHFAGADKIRPAKPEEVREITGYEIGAVSPFGFDAAGMTMVLDRSVLDGKKPVNVGSGRADTGFEMMPGELRKAWRWHVEDISE